MSLEGSQPGLQERARPRGPIRTDIPKDAYSTNGNRGQFTVIVPSHNLLIVRRGKVPEVKYPDVQVQPSGHDENAYEVLAPYVATVQSWLIARARGPEGGPLEALTAEDVRGLVNTQRVLVRTRHLVTSDRHA